MKKKIVLVFCILFIVLLVMMVILHMKKEPVDENALYSKKFGNTILKFERYDYVLGQRMLVGIEKSIDGGKTYTKVTDELATVSNESQFEFLDESLGFIISTEYIKVRNNGSGFVVTTDGGKTFTHAQFDYDNNRIEVITIEDFPYYKNDVLKLKCSVYDNPDGTGYQDIEIVFSSYDNGLNWIYEK